MRLKLSKVMAALLVGLMVGTGAKAAEPLPRIPPGASYPQVKQLLLGGGLRPVRVYRRNVGLCDPSDTPCVPELIGCGWAGVTGNNCELLFERRSDGRLFTVVTSGPNGTGQPSFLEIHPTDPRSLDGETIASADGHGRQTVCFPDKAPAEVGLRPPVRQCPPRPLDKDFIGAPRFKHILPYAAARRELVRQGFDPVRIIKRGPGDYDPCEDARRDICRAYPELLDCAGDAPFCEFLFRSRRNGSYWMVGTWTEIDSLADARRARCCGFSRAKRDIEGYLVLDRDGRRVRIPKQMD